MLQLDNNNEFNEANFKLAFSLEHRYKLFSKLDGAFFIDANYHPQLVDRMANST